MKSTTNLFLYLKLVLDFLWRKDICIKAARKMLVKLTLDKKKKGLYMKGESIYFSKRWLFCNPSLTLQKWLWIFLWKCLLIIICTHAHTHGCLDWRDKKFFVNYIFFRKKNFSTLRMSLYFAYFLFIKQSNLRTTSEPKNYGHCWQVICCSELALENWKIKPHNFKNRTRAVLKLMGTKG